MKICALQMNLCWCDVRANLSHAASLIRAHQGEGIDVFVLPEMFSTGFLTDPSCLVGSQEADIEQWMLRLSREMNALIVGSCIAGTCTRSNRLLMIGEGVRVAYNKRHLFAYGGEDQWYIPGDTFVSHLWRGVRFCPSVCYDLRFPAWLRSVFVPRPEGTYAEINPFDTSAPYLYDCLLNVANWPVKRQLAWDILLRARAVENQAYVVGCNRVGEDPTCTYQGGTAIINPYGETLASVPDNTEGAAVAEIDMDFLRRYREKFPMWKEADRLL